MRDPKFSRFVSLTASACGFSAGFITLIGWALDWPRLADWIGSGIAMFPNTAICAVFTAVALFLLDNSPGGQRQTVTRVLATVVVVIGGLTLFQHIIGINLGI